MLFVIINVSRALNSSSYFCIDSRKNENSRDESNEEKGGHDENARHTQCYLSAASV